MQCTAAMHRLNAWGAIRAEPFCRGCKEAPQDSSDRARDEASPNEPMAYPASPLCLLLTLDTDALQIAEHRNSKLALETWWGRITDPLDRVRGIRQL